MRAALAAVFAGAGLLAAGPAAALQAGDIAWGCKDAGYAGPVAPAPASGPAFRELVLLVHTDRGIIPATLDLPEGEVYADAAPRCADLDGDGEDEVVTVISGPEGTRLQVYAKRRGPLAATAPVAAPLMPAGTADFDGDGKADIAWLEDPLGAGRLHIAALRNGALVELAQGDGFSGRRPGNEPVKGGVRNCGKGPELVLANHDWSGLMRVRLERGALVATPLASATDPATVTAALACRKAETGPESE